jgi:hypothetical protein
VVEAMHCKCYRAYEGQEVDGLVRLLSCGHDGQLALWDFDTSPEALTPVRWKYSQSPCCILAFCLFELAPEMATGSSSRPQEDRAPQQHCRRCMSHTHIICTAPASCLQILMPSHPCSPCLGSGQATSAARRLFGAPPDRCGCGTRNTGLRFQTAGRNADHHAVLQAKLHYHVTVPSKRPPPRYSSTWHSLVDLA